MYIYIYRERERQRYIHAYIYIYISIYDRTAATNARGYSQSPFQHVIITIIIITTMICLS